MTVVTAPNAGFTGEVAGVSFVDGVGETDDENALNYFVRRGYAVEGLDDLPEVLEVLEDPVNMTKAELVAFAGANEIDITGASTKAEILEIIESWDPKA